MNIDKKLKIVESARNMFLRYGYKRVTMADIAEEADISRPAIYLLFQNKEEVFKAVVQHTLDQNLENIRCTLPGIQTPIKKLQYAFEEWVIRPYDMIQNSRDAKVIFKLGDELTADIHAEAGKKFEQELISIIKPHLKKQYSTKKMAHMIRGSVLGLKTIAKDTEDLRHLIHEFIAFFVQSSFI